MTSDDEKRKSTQLNDLLSDPKSFVRKNAEGEIEKYEYMEGVKKESDITPEHLEKGLFQMRQNAGIAMEYLEKSKECDEGKFIQDWEVIYGADNYKVVTDYMKNIYDNTQKIIDPSYDPDNQENRQKLYKTREELQDIKKGKRWVEIGFEAAVTGLDIWFNYGDLAVSTIDLKGKAVEMFRNTTLKELAKATNSVPLQILALGYDTGGDKYKILKEALDAGGKSYTSFRDKEKFADKLKEMLEKSTVRITEKLNLADTGFRVVVLKKKGQAGSKDNIVIAYKAKETKNSQLLPEERDYLRIVFNKIQSDNPDAKITFTGYEGGADLAFLSALSTPLEDNSNNGDKDVYQFKKGDTLWDLAEDRLGDALKWPKIVRKRDEYVYTEQTAKVIPIGEEVLIPSKGGNSNNRTKETYVFKEGDTLWDLAEDRLGDPTRWAEIVRKKDEYVYTEQTARRIPIGEEVLIPTEKINTNSITDVSATLFYNEMKEVKGFIDFTPEDINKNYQTNIKIVVKSEFKKVGSNALKKAFLLSAVAGLALLTGGALVVFAGGLVMIAIEMFVTAGIDFLTTWLGNKKIKKIYDLFVKDLKLIEPKKNDIVGYIADHYMDKPYIELETSEGKLIKVKKEHAVFLICDNEKNNSFDNINKLITSYGNSEYKFMKKVSSTDSGRGSSVTREYWKLEKNNNIYQITELIVEKTSGSMIATNNISKVPLSSKDQEEIVSGVMFANLLQVLGNIQRSYEKRRYKALEFIYSTDNSIKVSKVIPQVIEENKVAKTVNEYLFMPYLDEVGNIDYKKPELRDEYIASVFKSTIQNYKIYGKSYAAGRAKENEKNYYINAVLHPMKYSSNHENPFIFDYSHDFDDKDPDQELLKIMEKEIFDDMDEVFRDYGPKFFSKKVSPFNHYNKVLEKLKDSKESFEGSYYEIEDRTEKEKLWFLKEITGTFRFNPLAKSKMEYKYNPADFIIGGEYELLNAVIEEEIDKKKVEETKEDIQEDTEKFMSAITNVVFWGKDKANKIIDGVSEEAKEKAKFLKDEADKIYDHTLEELKVAKEEFSQSDEIREEEVSVGRKYSEPSKENRRKSFNNIIAH